MKLVQEMHYEKTHSMSKILEQWFVNKSNSFAFYGKAQEGLLRILNETFEDKRSKF